jgi:hypothetical protein
MIIVMDSKGDYLLNSYQYGEAHLSMSFAGSLSTLGSFSVLSHSPDMLAVRGLGLPVPGVGNSLQEICIATCIGLNEIREAGVPLDFEVRWPPLRELFDVLHRRHPF